MPKRTPFVVSSEERLGVILTLFAFCIFKLVEPSVYRFIQARYDRPIQWKVTDTVRLSKDAQKIESLYPRDRPSARNLLSTHFQRLNTNRVGDLGEINTADTTQLKRVYGIGSVLANRIVKYRAYLGHFVSIEQLKEVYNLPDTVYTKLELRFSLDTLNLNKIPINQASEKSLRRLPYLSKEEIRWVLEVRQARGGFKTKEELTNLFIKTLNKKPFILLYLNL